MVPHKRENVTYVGGGEGKGRGHGKTRGGWGGTEKKDKVNL